MFPYQLTEKALMVLIDGKPYFVETTNKEYIGKVVHCINKGCSKEELLTLVSAAEALRARTVTFVDDELYIGGIPCHKELSKRARRIVEIGLGLDPWIKFVSNLYQNPSMVAVEELCMFLEASNMPITDDGHFLAYKRVRQDLYDFWTRTNLHAVGSVVEMPRDNVNANRAEVCSSGLHFCSYGYLESYHNGKGVIVVLKINPADVVSIPSDYNNAKGRCCRYEIVEALTADIEQVEWEPVIETQEPAPNLSSNVVEVLHSKIGDLTKTALEQLLAEHGSGRRLALTLGVSTGTVQSWKTRLGVK